MSIFRKAIATVVIVSLLGLSTAWAFDFHAEDFTMNQHPAEMSAQASLIDDDHHQYDHCCHLGAHLLGL